LQTDFQNYFINGFSRKLSIRIHDTDFHITFTVLLQHLVKFEENKLKKLPLIYKVSFGIRNTERNVKTGLHLPKLRSKIKCYVFETQSSTLYVKYSHIYAIHTQSKSFCNKDYFRASYTVFADSSAERRTNNNHVLTQQNSRQKSLSCRFNSHHFVYPAVQNTNAMCTICKGRVQQGTKCTNNCLI